jgi:tRNA(fMet)-specific endonuclease VapC
MDKAAEIYSNLKPKGQLIENADILIAAIALVNGLVLVTHNVSHFKRIEDLEIEDWLNP